MSVSPEVLDRKPETEGDRSAILGVVLDQARELVHLEAERVTCPCGHRAGIMLAYHCYHCDVWFCRRCAARHFGEPA